jgi:hypothetical protein
MYDSPNPLAQPEPPSPEQQAAMLDLLTKKYNQMLATQQRTRKQAVKAIVKLIIALDLPGELIP